MQTVVGMFLLVNAFMGGAAHSARLYVALSFGLKALIILIALSVTGVLYARLRIDQLADLGWRVLAPLGLLQTLVTLWAG
jgi:NADH:ubiquinone oxidoreductase subunit H